MTALGSRYCGLPFGARRQTPSCESVSPSPPPPTPAADLKSHSLVSDSEAGAIGRGFENAQVLFRTGIGTVSRDGRTWI